MLQQDQPEDFVIATGVHYSVRQFIEWTAAELGMHITWQGTGVDEVGYAVIPPQNVIPSKAVIPGSTGDPSPQPIIRIDPRYFRPTEVETLLGDPTKAKQKLGWMPEITVQQMCAEMASQDLAEAKRIALLNKHGYHVNLSVE